MCGINVLIGFLMLGNSSAIITTVGAAVLLFVVGYIPIFFAYLMTGGRYLGAQGSFRLPRRVSLAVASFNAVSVVLQAILLCLPPFNPITSENMNWASAVAGSLLIFLFISFFFYGNSRYRPGDDLIIQGQDITSSEESGQGLTGKLAEVKGECFKN
jgi:choline transport protein